MSSKAELRKHLKQARLNMAEADRTLKSRAIVGRLKEVVNWSEIRSVHYFEPISELMEVDISPLIIYLEDNFTDIELHTPRLIEGEWEMISIKDKPAPEQFDVIFVPMLGFDDSLHRVGYGGGYYDKFLATQPRARKIGVCFEAGKVEQLPAELHDIPLDEIVTENSNYKG